MQTVVERLNALRLLVQKLGPYLMVEILMPGGSLLALFLFLYRSGLLARIRARWASAGSIRSWVAMIGPGVALESCGRPTGTQK
jgi:hypothetical protein